MSYLLIKKNDAKIFKAFLSGNEIEVGVHVGAQDNTFNQDEEVFIFYDNDNSGTYRARVTRHRKVVSDKNGFVMLGLVKG
jgi:hypothetical protein